MSSMSNALECPICLEVPSPPIYQCSNGHIFCSNCIKKITVCGICQEQLPGKPIRSLMAEILAENITKSEEREKEMVKKKSDEENKSSLIGYCNLLGLTDVLGCEEIIDKDQIVSHMKEHQLNGVNGNMADIIQELEYFTSPQSWFPVYFEAYDETFFLLSRLSGTQAQNDLNHVSSVLISWKCVMVGDTSAAKNFCLQLCLTNGDKSFKNMSYCPIIGIDHASSTDSQFSLTLSQLKQFGICRGEKKLEWTINVHIGIKSANANEFQKLENRAVPRVKTCSFALNTIAKPSSSLMRIIGNLRSENTKVFLDLAYENKLIGRLVIELRNDVVPFTVENFRCLCTGEKGFGYKGTCFYRIAVRNFMSGGDVTKDDGTGGKSIYGDTFKNENFSLKHTERGLLSMSNREKKANNSVFYITLREQPRWDGKAVVFGKVVEGMEFLDELEKLTSFFNYGYAEDKKTIIQHCGQL